MLLDLQNSRKTESVVCRELVVFLGFTNYYREFLLDFVKMTAGLNAVKAKKIIEWNENQVHCFNSVKTIFTQAPCQASPDFSVHSNFYLICGLQQFDLFFNSVHLFYL